ncbi:leukocyte receptor cluster member 1 [Chanos chanos]|uniref:Leukocyte receptor cluster member 1 n=1 Tax=Chanos chanos TaxID=29144 RepID=A0A6J2W552_CHACN|nr:leukocyte receptor cluster member 1 [Chanos chanos]
MNILPKKSWHVRNKDNIARVRRDEARAAEEERELQRRIERAEQEARTEYLRKKSRGALEQKGGWREHDEQSGGADQHLNLFPVEEATEKKGNAEYLKEKKEEKEKQERAIGLLVSLGPAPGTEATPWYMKDRTEREKEEDEGKDKKDKDRKRHVGIREEEKEKKDKRLKDSLDPLKDIEKALAVKEKKDMKKKKKDKRDKRERTSGESSIEKLRAERLQREAEERRRAQALLDQKNGKEKEKERVADDRDRPYNSAYFPELARKRQRNDRDQYGF